jgi:hypothetical protein
LISFSMVCNSAVGREGDWGAAASTGSVQR